MRALEELVSSWRANPDAPSTITLCAQLGSARRQDLIQEVGTTAESRYREDSGVMLALGRMYLDAGMLTRAQVALVSSGKLNSRDPRPLRYLGEVLLRRGDAIRAEKIFTRCIQLGMQDSETRSWHGCAVRNIVLQHRAGEAAVASEVAMTMPAHSSIAAPPVSSRRVITPPPLPQSERPVALQKALPQAAPETQRGARRRIKPATLANSQLIRGLLAAAVVIAFGVGIGAFVHRRHTAAERISRVRDSNAQIESLLHASGTAELNQAEQKLAKAYELGLTNQQTARLWLESRTLNALLVSGQARGIGAALERGRKEGLPERELVFGRIATLLVSGDGVNASALLPHWDKEAARDAYYQLAAGAALERAGNPQAFERYEAARKLDPKLMVANILLARALLLEGLAERGDAIIRELRAKLGDRPEVRALSALSWVTTSDRPAPLPDYAKLQAEHIDKLPLALRAVQAMVEAAQAVQSGDAAKAASAITSALSSSTSAALSTNVGFLAIEAGNEELARRAVERATSLSSTYPRARMLAARVALLGARLDEAQQAIEQLDPNGVDAARVRAAVAYETLQAAELRAALAALGDTVKTQHVYSALAIAPQLLTGSSLPPSTEQVKQLADASVLWGEQIAVDAAILGANLPLADKILSRHALSKSPVYLFRIARVRRMQNKLDEAVKASAMAIESGTPTVPMLIERVYCLLANQDPKAARELLAKHAAILLATSSWLRVLIAFAEKQYSEAVVQAGLLELPWSETALEIKILAARALAVVDDKRARGYLAAVSMSAPWHHDLAAAAAQLK